MIVWKGGNTAPFLPWVFEPASCRALLRSVLPLLITVVDVFQDGYVTRQY